MRITITARHCEIPDELRPRDARVIFADDHGGAAVEVRLHTARGKVHVGKALADDHRTALDRAAQRVRRQLDKRAVPVR